MQNERPCVLTKIDLTDNGLKRTIAFLNLKKTEQGTLTAEGCHVESDCVYSISDSVAQWISQQEVFDKPLTDDSALSYDALTGSFELASLKELNLIIDL